MGNKKVNYTFQRIEKKYLLDQDKYETLLGNIRSYLINDEHGESTICNIYYDTDVYDLIRTSLEKPKYKEKFRLRSYGIPKINDIVFLEIKKKYMDTVFKRRVSMTAKEADNYLEHRIKPNSSDHILKEIDYFIDFYNPKKKVYIAYNRVAYYGKEDLNLRITFDHNIRSRNYDLDLKKGSYGEELLDSSMYLMEIKTSSALPLWLTRQLSELRIYPISFSKVGNVYKKDIFKQRMQENIDKENLILKVN